MRCIEKIIDEMAVRNIVTRYALENGKLSNGNEESNQKAEKLVAALNEYIEHGIEAADAWRETIARVLDNPTTDESAKGMKFITEKSYAADPRVTDYFKLCYLYGLDSNEVMEINSYVNDLISRNTILMKHCNNQGGWERRMNVGEQALTAILSGEIKRRKNVSTPRR